MNITGTCNDSMTENEDSSVLENSYRFNTRSELMTSTVAMVLPVFSTTNIWSDRNTPLNGTVPFGKPSNFQD